jgi:hypothetical protein
MDTTERTSIPMAPAVAACPWCSAPAVLEPSWVLRCDACATVVEVAPDAVPTKRHQGTGSGHRDAARRRMPARHRTAQLPTIVAA